MGYYKTMTVQEVIFSNPETREIFIKYGLNCLGCLGAEKETLEEVCKINDIDEDKIIEELNGYIKNACV